MGTPTAQPGGRSFGIVGGILTVVGPAAAADVDGGGIRTVVGAAAAAGTGGGG